MDAYYHVEDNTCKLWDLKSKKVIKGIMNLTEPVKYM